MLNVTTIPTKVGIQKTLTEVQRLGLLDSVSSTEWNIVLLNNLDIKECSYLFA